MVSETSLRYKPWTFASPQQICLSLEMLVILILRAPRWLLAKQPDGLAVCYSSGQHCCSPFAVACPVILIKAYRNNLKFRVETECVCSTKCMLQWWSQFQIKRLSPETHFHRCSGPCAHSTDSFTHSSYLQPNTWVQPCGPGQGIIKSENLAVSRHLLIHRTLQWAKFWASEA